MTRLIYLHGFASGPSSKKAHFFVKRFAECGVKLEVPDLAEGDFEHLTISGQLRVIERAAAGEAVSLIGSSMGGYLAALYAARHPEVSRLVLMAPAFCFATRWPEEFGPVRMEEWRKTRKLPVFHYGAGGMRDLGYDLVEDGRQYEDYPEFTQPALIVHGTRDKVVPADLSIRFAAVHPNATLRLLDSGHELTDVLEPIWQAVSSFLLS